MHPTTTNITPALEQYRPTTTTVPVPWMERHIGDLAAAAAATILEALEEYQSGGLSGLSPATKKQIGETIWEMYWRRQYLVPFWDFDSIARERGLAALRAADVAPALAKIAIDAALEVLHGVVFENRN